MVGMREEGLRARFSFVRTRVCDPRSPRCHFPLFSLCRDAWDEDATLKDNFSSLGLMRDVNKGLKEKSRPALPGGVAVRRGASVDEVLAAEAARAQAAADAEDGSDESDEAAAPIEVDSEFLTAAGLGKASRPKPLTERQIRILEGLMDAHGMDVDAMVLDTKRNAMQHSAGALRNMLKSYAYYQGKTAAGFRAPIKKLIGRF